MDNKDNNNKENSNDNSSLVENKLSEISKKARKNEKLLNAVLGGTGVLVFFLMQPVAILISGYGQIEMATSQLISMVICGISYLAFCVYYIKSYKTKMAELADYAKSEFSNMNLKDNGLKKSKMSFANNK